MEKKISFISSLLISIGIVIGSGIFFKLSTVYEQTGYNYIYSSLAWVVIGILLVISSYAAAQVALRSESFGGLISFTQFSTNDFFANLVGIFQYVIYIPMFIALLSTKSIFYLMQALNLGDSVYLQYFLAFLLVSLIFYIQYNSTQIAAKLSDVTTVVKVIPLILIFILGLVFGDFQHISIEYTNEVSQGFEIKYLFAPFIGIALAFDGWISIGSIQTDMKNPKKDLYRVYLLSIIIITFIYFIYSVGVGLLLTPDDFMQYGDGYILAIGEYFGGQVGATILLLLVVTSTLGSLNGFFLSGSYYVQASARRKEIIGYKTLAKRNEKTGTYTNSITFTYITGLIMLFIYFIQDLMKSLEFDNMFTSLNIDDLTIFLGAVFFIIFFAGILFKIKMFDNKKTLVFISALIAVFTQIGIIYSFYATISYARFFTFLGILVILIPYLINRYYLRKY